MRKRTIILGLGLIAVAVAWYLFRPELLFVNARVQEDFPAAGEMESVVLARGSFHGVSHDGRGTATIHRLGDGRRVLRLTDFATSNGPALRVYLVADAGDVGRGGFIDLGKLKGNVGDQNYDVPADADLGKYRAVTVWCERFSVNFATAPLMPEKTVARGGGPR